MTEEKLQQNNYIICLKDKDTLSNKDELELILASIGLLPDITVRLVSRKQQFVYVDYAGTIDKLKQALKPLPEGFQIRQDKKYDIEGKKPYTDF